VGGAKYYFVMIWGVGGGLAPLLKQFSR